MADWYAPSDDFGPTIGEVDPQVGGQYRVGMLLPGQTDPRFVSGQYCRVDPPRTLSFTWAWEPHEARLAGNPGDPGIPSQGRWDRPGVDPRALPERTGQEQPRPGLARLPQPLESEVRGRLTGVGESGHEN